MFEGIHENYVFLATDVNEDFVPVPIADVVVDDHGVCMRGTSKVMKMCDHLVCTISPITTTW